jgi:Asp-tRNA(Asn)/Glu-tRNA(Gln) amidotransferase A subunit family amidase
LVHVDIAAAMRDAEEMHDAFSSQEERDSQPANFLHGLPIVVKDAAMVKDWPMTHGGSPLFEGHVAKYTDEVIKVLQLNGAIVVAMSNSSEFTAGSNTFNPLHGTTVTPFDTRRTAGGSSGGSACALATGQVRRT